MSKHILITGSTDGIGRETAKVLARKGWEITIHGRSRQRVEDTVQEIGRMYPNVILHGVTADLSSLEQVERMAGEVKAGPLVDVLLNNAGIVAHSFQRSEDGYEMTLAVNHLSHFFLTLLLLDHLREPARIINVSSMVHATSIDMDTLNDPDHFDPVAAYSRSKLCNVLFTYKLHRLLQGRRKITVNCLHPGVINTKVLTETWGAVGAPVSEGSRMTVRVAADPSLEKVSGAYFENGAQRRSAEVSYDEHLQDLCWEYSMEMIRRAGFSVEEPG
jgi:NAD(P)-dependent dehydrogenase (short-subunit alcohol dehydrogenase family)